MSLADIVDVQITASSAGIQRAGFGVPLIAAYHTKWGTISGERVRSYTGLAGMSADGFYANEPAYQQAQAIFSQNPRPKRIKVGRRASAWTQVIDLTPDSPTAGKVYTIDVNGEEFSITAGGGDTLADVCTNLAAEINTVIAADADSIKTNGVSTLGVQTITAFDGVVGTSDMVPARAVSFTFNSHADWDATNITVNGKDENGTTISELIAVPNGGNATVNGVRRFKSITSLSIPAQSGTNGTYTMGTQARALNENYAAIITNGGSTAGNQTLTGTSLNGSIGGREMSTPRAVALVLSDHADWDATTAVVTGLDVNGDSTTENLTIPNGGNTIVLGTTLFRKITSLYVPAQTGTGGQFVFGVRARYTASGASTTKVAVTATTAGTMQTYENATATLGVFDATADPGLSADLTAIVAADNDWYGLLLDSNSEAEIEVAAADIETMEKFFVAQSADTEVLDGGSTTDVGADLETSAYGRTTLWYHPSIGTDWLAAGLMGNRFPRDPGSDTWAFKTIAGVSSYALTDTQKSAAHAKQVGTYTEIAGVAVTEQGKVAANEWIDVVRGIDWLRARMRERVFALIVANEKLAYIDASVEMIKGELRAELDNGIAVNFLSSDPAPVVSAPLVADIDDAEKEARNLPVVEFSATLAGAIHSLTISGTVSV